MSYISDNTNPIDSSANNASFAMPGANQARVQLRQKIVAAAICGLLSFLIITYIVAFIMSIVIIAESGKAGEKSGVVSASGVLIILLPFIGSIIALIITSDLK